MNKFGKISACLCSAALLGSSAAFMPATSVSPLVGTQIAKAAGTFQAHVIKEGNGNFSITNGSNDGTFSSEDGVNIVAIADDGYFVDKVYFKSANSSSWTDLSLLGNWKFNDYPKNAPFSYTTPANETVNLKIVFSQLPAGQSNTDTGTNPTTKTGMLNIIYHSSLNGASSDSLEQVPFNLNTQQIASPLITTIASLEKIRIGLQNQGKATDSVTPNEHTTFKGWAKTNGGTPLYQENQNITYSLWESATTVDELNRTLELYAIWEFDDSPVADFSADCYIDNNLYSAFTPEKDTYEFNASADTAQHTVSFKNFPSNWNHTSSNGITKEVDGNITHNTAYIQYVFTRNEDNKKLTYTFKWNWDTQNSTPIAMTLERALANATLSVKDKDNIQQATISPAFSYNTTTYTATGADLSQGISVQFSNLQSSDVNDPVIGQPTTQVSSSNGVRSTIYTYPVTVSRGTESKTFYIKYTKTETETQPSYDELANLKATVNGTTYTAFSPTVTSYSLPDSNSSYEILLTGIPSGWTATKTPTSGTNSASLSFTLTKGSLSRTYTFSWKAPTAQPSYNDLSQISVLVDNQQYSGFSPSKTTYDMGETTSSHTVRFANVPSGWTDKASSNVANGKMTITHVLTNENLSRSYTFQWSTPSTTPSNAWSTLKFAVNGSNYSSFDPDIRSYVLTSPIERSSWSGLPSGTTASNKTSSVKNGDKTKHTLTWTLKYNGESRDYAFSWETANTNSTGDSGNSGNSGSNNGSSSHDSGNNSGSSGNNGISNNGSSSHNGSNSGNDEGNSGGLVGGSESGSFSKGDETEDSNPSTQNNEGSQSETSQPTPNQLATNKPAASTPIITNTTTARSNTAQEQVNIPVDTREATSTTAQPLSSTGENNAPLIPFAIIASLLAVCGGIWRKYF